MAMGAVGRAAMAMIEEVRRQFNEIPELRKALELMNLKMKMIGAIVIVLFMKMLSAKQSMGVVLRFLHNQPLKRW